MHRLPPLNALRAFEAAARHGGFIPASEELHVTRGAISRHARGVDLTDAGRRLLPVLTEAFERIARETAGLAADAAELRILCPPATSIRWLIPRLDRFRARHPEMAVRLTTDFHGNRGSDASEYDIAFTVEHWPRDPERFVVEPLFPVLISPACTPEIARCLSDPGDLASCTLLNEPLARDDWGAWLARFPVTGLDLKKSGSDFPNLDLATRAAIMGAGVVMADFLLCRDELSAGALVLPFPDMVCESPYGAVSLLGLRDTWDSAKVRAFRDWALEEAQADVQALKALGMS